MIVVIVETYRHLDDIPPYMDDTTIENVYGPFNTDSIRINDVIIQLEHKRESYNTHFEIMPLISLKDGLQ